MTSETLAPCPDTGAKHLAGKGAEIMAIDATNATEVGAAFEGAYSVFYVTVPYEIFSGKEFAQGVAAC